MYDPEFLTPRSVKKSRGGLDLTAQQRRYLTSKQNGYYLEKRGLEILSTEKISKRIKKGQNAAFASWYKTIDIENPPDFPNHEYNYNPLGTLKPGMIEARKKAVEYFFVQKYGSPPEEQWHHEGIVGDIIKDIGAPLGSRSAIVEILRNILLARNNKTSFSGKKVLKKPADRFIIKDGTDESATLYDLLQKVPISQAVILLNTWRQEEDPPLGPISFSAVYKFVVRSNKV